VTRLFNSSCYSVVGEFDLFIRVLLLLRIDIVCCIVVERTLLRYTLLFLTAAIPRLFYGL